MNDVIRSERAGAYLAANEIRESWSNDYLEPGLDRFYDLAFERLVRELGAFEGAEILDAGCGECAHALRLARRGLRVTGVDFSQRALRRARSRIAAAGMKDRVRLVQGDLRALRLRDGAFRFVSSWGVLMHVPEVERALAELARVTAVGGRLAIMENNRDALQVRTWDRAIRITKRLIGRPVGRLEHTPRGLEEWREEGLLVRRVDAEWLEQQLASHGMRLVARFAGQFTEAYTTLPVRSLKRAVQAFDEVYLQADAPARYALGNVFVFEKR